MEKPERRVCMQNNFLIALCGRSGSGKSSISQELKDKYGWTSIESYTTRPKRAETEKGHIFISEEEFDRISENSRIAFTKFDGYRYCTTAKQVEKAEIYVVDFSGVRELKERYHGNKTIAVVFLDAPTDVLEKRMRQRGDLQEKIQKRMKNDDRMFREEGVEIDLRIDARKSIQEIANTIANYIETYHI